MQLTVARAPHLRRAGLVLTIAGLMAIAFATLPPGPPHDPESIFCFGCGSTDGVDAILNVFLFAPLGLGLALAGLSGKRALPAMCALSILIETAQFFVIPGRYSSIEDVLTNTLGGALGFAIGRYALTLLRPSPRTALALSAVWSSVWLAIQAVSAFSFSPAIPRSEYYGQIAPRLGGSEQFEGIIVRGSIADVRVPDTRFPDSHRVQELLLGGAIVTAAIVPAKPPNGIAPIVRLADDREREIVLLAQDSKKLVFGVRTGAAVLRLRPPLFALPDAFPSMSPGNRAMATDTVVVRARYSAREVWVSTRARTSHDGRIPLTASLGWTMLMPFQWFIEGTPIELVLSYAWIAILMFPTGYWLGAIAKSRGSRTIRAMVVPFALALLYVGLLLVPHEFGMATAPPSEWLAAWTGILLGGALGLRLVPG